MYAKSPSDTLCNNNYTKYQDKQRPGIEMVDVC